jgi:hypothetical protein
MDLAGNRLTRRGFLKAAGAGAAWITLTGTLGCEPAPRLRATASRVRPGQAWTFRSRPDLGPPSVEVTERARGTAPGYVFAASKNGPGEEYPAQDGPMILASDGQPVWLCPVRREKKDAMDFKVQRYRGEPVLTWWEGVHNGYGEGEYLILDSSYREVTRVRAGNGYRGDHHEFLITPEDTALITIYHKVPMDLSSVGGSKEGAVMDGIVQEVDIATGEVLFEWHSLDHVALGESYYEPPKKAEGPFDYFHINSIDVDHDGSLLVSGRRTSAVYKIDRQTSHVIWRLGGKKSDFEMGEDARFAYQHDARRHPNGTLTIFDNRGENMNEQSRGITLNLDEVAMTATLLREYTNPKEPFAIYQGNVQTLPDGNVFVGWGSAPYLSEFGSDGKLLFDARFPPEVESYRAFRFPWNGQPDEAPALATGPGPDDEVTLYASWNGATEVATWEVLAGPAPEELKSVGFAPRKGFETVIRVPTAEPYLGVQAKNRSGRVLGASKAIKPET